MNLIHQLSPEKQAHLTAFLENELHPLLQKFEEAYGYRGHLSLVKWLVFSRVFKEDLQFNHQGVFFMFYTSRDFLDHLDKYKQLQGHWVTQYTYSESIGFFTPYLFLCLDGTGNSYFASFTREDSDVAFYDHECLMGEFIRIKKLNEIYQYHSIPGFPDVLDEIINNLDLSSLGLSRNLSSMRKISYFSISRAVKDLMHGMDVEELRIGKHDIRIDLDEIFALMMNKDSDYFQYDNVRAIYNPLIIVNLYHYYLSGQINELRQLLVMARNVKGKYYQVIIQSFELLVSGDYSQFGFTRNQLQGIRKDIENFNSELLEKESMKLG